MSDDLVRLRYRLGRDGDADWSPSFQRAEEALRDAPSPDGLSVQEWTGRLTDGQLRAVRTLMGALGARPEPAAGHGHGTQCQAAGCSCLLCQPVTGK